MDTPLVEYSDPNFRYHHIISTDPNTKFGSTLSQAHTHYEILFFIKGDVTYILEDKSYKLMPYDIVLVKPNAYHYLQFNSNQEYERYLFSFTKKQAEYLCVNLLSDKEQALIRCQNPKELNRELCKFDFYFNRVGPKSFSDVALPLLKTLFYYLNLTQLPLENPQASNTYLSEIINYINNNLFAIKSLEEVCDYIHISYSYLVYLFKTSLHVTPKKYITEKRLLAAQNLLELGRKPFHVWEECGFTSYTVFFRNYVRFFGVAPTDYKKNTSLLSVNIDG